MKSTAPFVPGPDPLLVETIDALLAKECTPERAHAAEGCVDNNLWKLLADNGLTAVGRPESVGGSGGTLHDLVAIVKAAGRHHAPVPLADTLIGATLLGDVPVPEGSLSIAVVRPGRNAIRVPWAPVTDHIVAVSSAGTALHTPGALTPLRSGVNYAGEPWHEYDPGSLTQGATDNGVRVDDALGAAAFGRAILLAGALDRAVDLTIQYTNEREQFGKSIGKFQIIQHYLSELAGEAAASNAAVDNAVDVIHASTAQASAGHESAGGDSAGGESAGGESARTEHFVAIAAAKAYTGRAVGTVARLAHQIHGAIGYTDEHRLQYTTRRLWAWRDEFGSEAEWAAVVGHSFASPSSNLLARITAWPPAIG